jgi:hypothetical protein
MMIIRPPQQGQGARATPHIGYVTEELYRTFYRDAAASIAWLDTSAK